jgi:hypothetical protein
MRREDTMDYCRNLTLGSGLANVVLDGVLRGLRNVFSVVEETVVVFHCDWA